MLIVVAIIGILIAIVVPTINSSLEKSREATDLANIRAAMSEINNAYLTGEGTYFGTIKAANKGKKYTAKDEKEYGTTHVLKNSDGSVYTKFVKVTQKINGWESSITTVGGWPIEAKYNSWGLYRVAFNTKTCTFAVTFTSEN